MTDRAANETIGFVLVFAIITVMIGMTYATGFSGIEATKDAEQMENMERAFDVLDDNTHDLYRFGAPSRATEVKLAGGSIEFVEPTQITIRTNGTGCGSPCPRYNNSTSLPSMTPVAYTEEGTQIAYVAGATFRSDDEGSVMLTSPDWVANARRAVIPAVVTYAGGKRDSLSGRTTILIVAQRASSPTVWFNKTASGPPDTLLINVSVESERSNAWKLYFEDQGYDVTRYDPENDVVYAEFETDTIYVPKTDIELRLTE